MTEKQALNQARALWGENAYAMKGQPSRRDFLVGIRGVVFGFGRTWDVAFQAAKANMGRP